MTVCRVVADLWVRAACWAETQLSSGAHAGAGEVLSTAALLPKCADMPRTTFRLIASAILAVTLVGCSGSNAPLGGETARGEPDPSGLLGSAAGASDGLAADTTGVYIADSGFRPTADGFSFENYGNDAVPANLGPAELQALFGNEVCNDEIADRCSLSSAAVTWMHQINQAMAGGHCEGMAVLSQLFDEGSRSPSTFGGDTAWELDLQESPGLAPAIAKWFATQVTSPTSESTLTTLEPNQVLEILTETLGQPRTLENTYTIGIFQRGFQGGHAVTPYAIEDRGDGIYWIMIYDNNYPGVPRAIEIDENANTWQYNAATNPNETEDLYEGDGESKTMQLTALSARLETQACPFCAGEAADELSQRDQLSLTGEGARLEGTDFYVTGPTGRVFGRVGGQFVSDMDEARVIPIATGLEDEPAPILDVPGAFDLQVTITAPSDGDANGMDFAMVGHGYDVLMDGIDLSSGRSAVVGLSQDGSSVSYTSSNTSTPVFDLATGDDHGTMFDIRVSMTDMEGPGTFEAISPDDDADVGFRATVGGKLTVQVTRITPDGQETVVSTSDTAVDAGETLMLPLRLWSTGDDFSAEVVAADGVTALRQLPLS